MLEVCVGLYKALCFSRWQCFSCVLLYVWYVIEAIALLDLSYSCRYLMQPGAKLKDYLIYFFS